MKHVKMTSRIIVNGTCYEAGKIYEIEDADLEAAQAVEGKDYELVTEKEVADAELDEVKQRAAEQRATELKKAMTAVLDERFPKQKAPAVVQQLGYSSERDKFESEFSIARAYQCLAFGAWNKCPREKAWYEQQREIRTTMTGVTDTGGGFAIAPEKSDEMFDMTYNKAVVMQCGVRTVPMNSDTLDVTGLTTAATTYWLGETTITATGVTEDTTIALGERTLVAKTLCCLLPLSNLLLADANPRLENFIKDHLSKEMATRLDLALIQGSGTAPAPPGLTAQVSTNTNTTATAGTNFSLDVMHNARYNVQVQNYDVNNWITDPYGLNLIRLLTSSTGQYLWQPNVALGEPGNVHGIPVRVTMNARDAVTATTHYLIGGDFREMMIGERQGFTLDIDKSYRFHQMTTCLLASIRVGVVLLHQNAFHVETLTE